MATQLTVSPDVQIAQSVQEHMTGEVALGSWLLAWLVPAMDAPAIRLGQRTMRADQGFIGGYVRSRSRAERHYDPKVERYCQWKRHVDLFVPRGLLRYRPTEAAPIRCDVFCWFRTRTHHDPDGVRKGIVDVAWPFDRGGDKHVYGLHGPAQYDREHPGVVVLAGSPDQFVGLDVTAISEGLRFFGGATC